METMRGYNHIHFRKGYKYQLAEEYQTKTRIRPIEDVDMEFISLKKDGLLIVRQGYAWDGPSGPTVDTPDFMRASLVHDAIYQLIGEGHVMPSWKGYADDALVQLCEEDGMWRVRRWWVFLGVDKVGPKQGSTPKPVFVAP